MESAGARRWVTPARCSEIRCLCVGFPFGLFVVGADRGGASFLYMGGPSGTVVGIFVTAEGVCTLIVGVGLVSPILGGVLGGCWGFLALVARRVFRWESILTYIFSCRLIYVLLRGLVAKVEKRRLGELGVNDALGVEGGQQLALGLVRESHYGENTFRIYCSCHSWRRDLGTPTGNFVKMGRKSAVVGGRGARD